MNATSCYWSYINFYTLITYTCYITYLQLQFWQSRPSRIQKQPPKVFFKILKISPENNCVGVSFSQSCQSSDLKRYLTVTPTQVFSCEIWEILKNSYFEEHLKGCFCVMIASSYIDFYNPLQYTFFIFTSNLFFITQLKQ